MRRAILVQQQLTHEQLTNPEPEDPLDDFLDRVVEEGKAEISEPYAGPLSDHPDSSRQDGPGPYDGWDCSSFVAGMYSRASEGRIRLTAFTDAIARETVQIDPAEARPGDIILWRYNSSGQPGVTYPHVGLWLDAERSLDCRYNSSRDNGVRIWPILGYPYEIHRVREFLPARRSERRAGAGGVQTGRARRVDGRDRAAVRGPAGFTAEELARVLDCPLEHVRTHWPPILRALGEQGIADRAGQIAALAIIGVEAPAFTPRREAGEPQDFERLYEWRADLGNTRPGDGARYHGRGFIPLTGRADYRKFGQMLRLPLEEDPDLALLPGVAARVLAAFIRERRIAECVAQGDWDAACRRRDGNAEGLDRYLAVVQALDTLVGGHVAGSRANTAPSPRRRGPGNRRSAARAAGLALGACWPYIDQRRAPPETWDVLRAMDPECVRVVSNAAREDLVDLHAWKQDLRWIVRTRDPKIDQSGQQFPPGPYRPGLLYYRAWDTEPTLHETLQLLLSWGCSVDVEMLNEPDIEWDEPMSMHSGEWEPTAQACRQFLEWQLGEIRGAFPNESRLRLVGPALSEGWEDRHRVWLDVLDPLYRQCDALAVHAYTQGKPFDDREWGGRPLTYHERFPDKPLLLTEVNDNGHAGCENPRGRGEEIGRYLSWLAGQRIVELACLFALPGQIDGAKDWWPWSNEMLAGMVPALA